MTLQSEGVGYEDLNNFLKNPCDLEFTIGMYYSAKQNRNRFSNFIKKKFLGNVHLPL